jgi:hypothetical protein
MSRYAARLCWFLIIFAWLCSRPSNNAESQIFCDTIIGYADKYDYVLCSNPAGCVDHASSSKFVEFDPETRQKIVYHYIWYVTIDIDCDIRKEVPKKVRHMISDKARMDTWHNHKTKFYVYWGAYIKFAERLEE